MKRLLTCLALLASVTPIARGNDLAGLGDDFNNPATAGSWQQRHIVEAQANQLERWEINPADAPGRMLMMPHTGVWFEGYRGPLVFKNVTGDFAFSTAVVVRRRNGAAGVPTSQYSLAGLMLRTAPTPVGAPENYVFLSIGHGTGGNAQFEVKSTMAGTSRLVLSNAGTLLTQLQIARIGDKIITLYRRPGDPDWVVHRVYDSDSANPFLDHSLGTGELQAGFVTYTDWDKASTFDPAYHNANTLTAAHNAASNNPAQPFNPDLVAEFEFARFRRLVVPGGLPDNPTDRQVLDVLGVRPIPEPGAALGAVAAGAVLLTRRRRG